MNSTKTGHRTIGGWLAAMVAGVVAVVHLLLANTAMAQGGQVVQWGRSAVMPGSLIRFTEVACGAAHTYALKGDGRVLGWGNGLPQNPWTPNSILSGSRGRLEYLGADVAE